MPYLQNKSNKHKQTPNSFVSPKRLGALRFPQKTAMGFREKVTPNPHKFTTLRILGPSNGRVWICIAGVPGPQNSLRDQGFLRALFFSTGSWFLAAFGLPHKTPPPPHHFFVDSTTQGTPILKVNELGFFIHFSFHPSPSWNHFLPPESFIHWNMTFALPFWWIPSTTWASSLSKGSPKWKIRL